MQFNKEILTVFKIGGGVIENSSNLDSFLQEFAAFPNAKILVHGGGRGADKLLEKLDIQPTMIEGRRITDEETLDIVTMYYAGLINKKIVGKLQSLGCNAIGLCGADANLISAKKRPVQEIDYGFVGDLHENSINNDKLKSLLNLGLVPVFSAITHENGQLLNTNADGIAAQLALSLQNDFNTSLHYCFEHLGVLEDINDLNSYIPEINFEDYQTMKKENTVFKGMIPKLDNAFKVLHNGISEVILEHPNYINKKEKTRLCL